MIKKIFVIETKKRITAQELLGCLEDTLGKNQVNSVKELSGKNE